MLGDGQNLQAVGRGNVVLTMNLPQGKVESCTLHDVLLVPDLAYNLLSVTSASKKGKVTTFSEIRCEIRDSMSKLIASGHREGSLYYLDHGGPIHQACSSSDHNGSKETIWHRWFGHLGVQGMQVLAKSKMVSGLDFDWKQESSFCESCVARRKESPFTLPTVHRKKGRASTWADTQWCVWENWNPITWWGRILCHICWWPYPTCMGLYSKAQRWSISAVPRVESPGGKVEWKKDQDSPLWQWRSVYLY